MISKPKNRGAVNEYDITILRLSKKTTKKSTARSPARLEQTKIMHAVRVGLSQHAAAGSHNIPKSVLKYWFNRQGELGKRKDPVIVIFFESSSGISFLHRLLTAILLIFHKVGDRGLSLIGKFIGLANLSYFAGSSLGILHKISYAMDKLLWKFGIEEKQKLSFGMPSKKITGCVDETFFKELMLMVFMDATSGFILAEQVEDQRNAET